MAETAAAQRSDENDSNIISSVDVESATDKEDPDNYEWFNPSAAAAE